MTIAVDLGRKAIKQANKQKDTLQEANNKGADQTVRMRSLVCAFFVRKQQSQGGGGYDAEAQASWPPLGYAPDIYF